MKTTINFDGSHDWKTGNSTGGAVVRIAGKVHEFNWDFGVTTMQGCEFKALTNAVIEAKKLGATELAIYGDSKLVVNICNRRWKAKLPHIRAYRNDLHEAIGGIRFKAYWIPREQNEHADRLAREVSLDKLSMPALAVYAEPVGVVTTDWLEDVAEFIS